MATSPASKTDAVTAQAENKNAPRKYVMLREKMILGRWRDKGAEIELKPSQAEYHILHGNLKLKETK
ncbi:hypothetical protein K6O87_004141 [Vibrio vulnificus]|nr:hypothetical protein [Vibrio vulnificus]